MFTLFIAFLLKLTNHSKEIPEKMNFFGLIIGFLSQHNKHSRNISSVPSFLNFTVHVDVNNYL